MVFDDKGRHRRDPPSLALRRGVLRLRAAGPRHQSRRKVLGGGTGAARQGERRVAEGLRLLHLPLRSATIRPASRRRRTTIWSSLDGRLLLHFTLPLAAPLLTRGTAHLEVYDPEYYVAFTLPNAEAVRLVNAPAACTLAVHPGHDARRRGGGGARHGRRRSSARCRRACSRLPPASRTAPTRIAAERRRRPPMPARRSRRWAAPGAQGDLTALAAHPPAAPAESRATPKAACGAPPQRSRRSRSAPIAAAPPASPPRASLFRIFDGADRRASDRVQPRADRRR